jgi:hypothetical protein
MLTKKKAVEMPVTIYKCKVEHIIASAPQMQAYQIEDDRGY